MTVLADELANDPLGRGYNGPGTANAGPGPMSDKECADDLNTAYRETVRDVVTPSEVLNTLDMNEYRTLDAAAVDEYWRLLSIREINPFGIEADFLEGIFGDRSLTFVAFEALRKTPMTRGQELGLGRVKTGDVQGARRVIAAEEAKG